MTKDRMQDPPAVSGDPVLLNVLATAQRFAAWYAEYLAGGVTPPGPAANDHDQQRRADELSRQLQHAVFDLMAAVHEMNRCCAGEGGPHEARQGRVLSLARAAVH